MSMRMIDNSKTRGQSETTVLIRWFQSDDKNGYRVKISKSVCDKLSRRVVENSIMFTPILHFGRVGNEGKSRQ